MDLDSTEIGIATVKDLNNFSPFAKDEKKKSGMSQKILIALVVMLALAILILLVFLIVLVFRKDPNAAMAICRMF